ncbi:hypothetical protein EDB92DRAFT_1893442, partial [Lactarius akahatsu]
MSGTLLRRHFCVFEFYWLLSALLSAVRRTTYELRRDCTPSPMVPCHHFTPERRRRNQKRFVPNLLGPTIVACPCIPSSDAEELVLRNSIFL